MNKKQKIVVKVDDYFSSNVFQKPPAPSFYISNTYPVVSVDFGKDLKLM